VEEDAGLSAGACQFASLSARLPQPGLIYINLPALHGVRAAPIFDVIIAFQTSVQIPVRGQIRLFDVLTGMLRTEYRLTGDWHAQER